MGRRVWGVELEVLLVLVLGVFFVNVEERMQVIRRSHPMRRVIDRVNEDGGPSLGLVMDYPHEELALRGSGFVVPNPDTPWIELAGRRFHIGNINGANVIYVMTREQTTNASLTVQVLLDPFV
ncbi:bark storage protein B-like [Herrania umbratica]|uniref:Bark storage protein B-like n=1 Tax=Herrania umbratica TaxID=108875 RepID=A0A6J1A4B8_9ROSI|nr:bark storage protein B-like [Herrania umbratica]